LRKTETRQRMSSPFAHPIPEEADQDKSVGAATLRSIAMTPPPNSIVSAQHTNAT
jgi:hypothetical protein